MPSTHTSLYYHLIFATKNREPLIAPAWRHRLHDYLGGIVGNMGGIPQGIGGVADHVHLLVSLKASHCLADFVRDLKKSSSTWVSTTIPEPRFRWQEGYAAFTVSASNREAVQVYVANQEEHHYQRSFQEELRIILEKVGVPYKDEYLD